MSKQTKFVSVEPKGSRKDRGQIRQGRSNLANNSHNLPASFWNFTAQQQQPSSNKATGTQRQQLINFPNLSNAPTSLANLAQMSGVSLVPVTNHQQQNQGSINLSKQTSSTHIESQYRQRPGNSNMTPVARPSQAALKAPILQNILPVSETHDPNNQASVFDPMNFDMGNFSLMKLMAILNNPALTITAVGETSADASLTASSTCDRNNDAFLMNAINNQRLNNQVMDPKAKGTLNNDHNTNGNTQQMGRIPKSAANLQVVYGDTLRSTIHPTDNGIKLPNKSNLSNRTAELSKLPVGSYQRHDFDNSWMSKESRFNGNNGSFSTQTLPKTNSTEMTASIPISTSLKNLMIEQSSTRQDSRQPPVSVHLLRHINDQTKDNKNLSERIQHSDKPVFEPECIISVPRPFIKELSPLVKHTEISVSIISTHNTEKGPKDPLKTSKNRLYIPRKDNHCFKKMKFSEDHENSSTHTIQIKDEQIREVPLSERHFMLDSMMNKDDSPQVRNDTCEPDDIFVDRSKRVMSRIDIELEKRKRKRFERISGRAASDCQHKVEDMDSEVSDDEDSDIAHFIPIQLPLEENLTNEKRNHLLSVGLVSRDEKNKLKIDQCERKLDVICPLIFEEAGGDILNDAERLVATLLKTGGHDIQLRTESSIKRSDLPLIEGLNRNTSRMKMSFMSSLGLEKRSRRTTLYKVKNGQENSSVQQVQMSNESKQQVQMSNESKQHQNLNLKQNLNQQLIDLSKQLKGFEKKSQSFGTLKTDCYKRPAMSENLLAKTSKRALMSCREALKAPTKDEYMKSLGLMAS